jgi:1-acylglycerone phosphate reductase
MPLLDSDLQMGRDLYDINVFGVIAVTQAFFPLLRNAKGMIANIGSIVGVGPLAPYQGTYLSWRTSIA